MTREASGLRDGRFAQAGAGEKAPLQAPAYQSKSTCSPPRFQRVGQTVSSQSSGMAGSLGDGRLCVAFGKCPALLGTEDGRVGRHEQRCAAGCQERQPLAIELPGNVVCQAGAIGVGGEKGVVLGDAEGQGIDPHLARAFPFTTACVVADPLELEEAGPEMANRVAADEQCITGGVPDGLVQVPDDLGGRAGADRRMPSHRASYCRPSRSPIAPRYPTS